MAIHVLNASGTLGPFVRRIADVTESTASVCDCKLDLDTSRIDIVVCDRATRTVPHFGVGGFCSEPHLLFIYLDPTLPDFGEVVESRLRQTLAHELHHAKRHSGPGYGRTLLQVLVSEGLAQQFASDVSCTEPPFPRWAHAPHAGEAIAELRARASEVLDERPDQSVWFARTPAQDVRPAAAYVLSYHAVRGYLEQNPGETAASLALADAESFRAAISACRPPPRVAPTPD